MFTISKLRFLKDCKYLKNLQVEQDYILEHKIDKNFYADNICISAIVGRNGAGKSSLLDMLFRIINNLSYCYLKYYRDYKEQLVYITGIYADLTYCADQRINLVEIRDKTVRIKSDKEYFFEISPEGDINHRELLSFTLQKSLAKSFFYTIATNYSMQSYIGMDYMNEIVIANQYNFIKDSWINKIFHKNDGYLCPLVLNPCRNNGIIDINNEAHLTTSRIAALFLEEDAEHTILEGYRFDHMSLFMNDLNFLKKFHSIMDEKLPLLSESPNEIYNRDELLKLFKDISKDKHSYAHIILGTLRCSVKEEMDNTQLCIRLYLVYKVLSIASKYPTYYYYKQYFGDIDQAFHAIPNGQYESISQKLRLLVNSIQKDKSHVTLKFRQALNFIKASKNLSNTDFETSIDYQSFAEDLHYPPKGIRVKERMAWLPPGIFGYNLFLKNTKTGTIVNFNQLSTGEKQYLYTTSTLIYHALNLSSIPKNGTTIRYNKINFILDEVEICFHPEYQRQFLKKLRDQIIRLEINKNFDVNILFTTHSPFILSDIPRKNILSLENGRPYEMNCKETFGSNVYDLLNNNFFMTQFIGDIAAEKIDHIVNELQTAEKNPTKDLEKIKTEIKMIGDEFIKSKLMERWHHLKDKDPLMGEYHMLQERIKEIEKRIAQKENDTN